MIRRIHNLFVVPTMVVLMLALTGFSSTAQGDFEDSRTAKQIIDSYPSFEEAVLEMTRDEWAVVRAWEDFDEVRYLTFLHDYHDSFDAKREENKAMRLQKIMQNDACGCWVEPDDSYTTMVPPPGLGGLGPNEMAWENEGGAGWNVDCSSAPIAVSNQTDPWEFDLYGASYEFFYINSKGQISFGGDVIDWTPTGFPAAEYNQIAGYWQDTDIRSVGEIKWKKTQDAVYVNFIDVGYYNNQDDLTNSFQIIITHPESGVLPDGNNAQVCYLDMNWAHGDVGGSGGCCGPDPGVTGADGESTNPNLEASPHVQFGRFNLPDDTYNGPYGIGADNEDGINWLDYKFFNINTALTNNNLNPVPTANLGCDTISLCLGQTTSLNVEFLGPEPGQTVALDIQQSLAGASYIDDESVSNGGTATFTGTFVADGPGVSTITMEATDSEGAVTTVDIVINVLDIVPPSIEVTSSTGDFGICAGAELDVTAQSVGGQESVEAWSWNLNPNFWDGNEATIPFGGTFVVTGDTPGGCEVKEVFEVFQTPYYLPTITGNLQTVCPGDSALVQVVQQDDENFVDWIWTGDWNGGGGEVLESNGPLAYVTPGIFQVTVVDEGGCEGKRTFIISPTAASIPEVTVDPMCGGAPFDTVTFSGGYASPSEGLLSLQLFSSISGWDGSFLNIDIIHEDGTTTNEIVTLNSGGFANVDNNQNLALVYGDTISIEFVSNNPENDQYFSLSVFNCVTNCITIPDACDQIDDLSDGIIYYQPALCSVQPAFGEWQVEGPAESTFSDVTQYNTTWWPSDFGLYELCFADEECQIDFCYEVEVTLPPSIELSEEGVAYACDGDDLFLEAFIDDPAGAASINWPYPGTDDQTFNEYSWTQYTESTLVVSVENGCGEATDEVDVVATFEPLMDNDYLCGDGSSLLLDPIAGDQNTDNVYEWTYNGNPADVQDNEFEVFESGSYCVTVTNGCFPNGESDCAFIDVVGAIEGEVFTNNILTDCDGLGVDPGELATFALSNNFILSYNDYTITWPDGTVTAASETWTIPEESELNGQNVCIQIEDPYGCDPQEACAPIFIGNAPTINSPFPPESAGLTGICEGETEGFDMDSSENGPWADYLWYTLCGEDTLFFAGSSSTVLSYYDFPESCLNTPLEVVANVANACLPDGESHVFDVTVGRCDVLIPNVFTPQATTGANDKFQIGGLAPWESRGVAMEIYDRWGNKVFESDAYTNDGAWSGENASEGVYFYTMTLPKEPEPEVYKGTLTLIRGNN